MFEVSLLPCNLKWSEIETMFKSLPPTDLKSKTLPINKLHIAITVEECEHNLQSNFITCLHDFGIVKFFW